MFCSLIHKTILMSFPLAQTKEIREIRLFLMLIFEQKVSVLGNKLPDQRSHFSLASFNPRVKAGQYPRPVWTQTRCGRVESCYPQAADIHGFITGHLTHHQRPNSVSGCLNINKFIPLLFCGETEIFSEEFVCNSRHWHRVTGGEATQ